MNGISKIKTYLNSPSKCFIPKCKAHCCINAPLPAKWVKANQESFQRSVFGATFIGKSSHYDNDYSYVYNTRPIQYVGHSEDGKALYGIPKETLDELQIKSMEDIETLLKQYDGVENYCPFITPYARCSVYEKRPRICREFGTLTDKDSICPEKSSRKDIVKFYMNEMFNFKNFYKRVKILFKKD